MSECKFPRLGACLAGLALALTAAISQAANDYVVAASGGDITGAQLSQQLAQGNVTLQSSKGGKAGSGNVIINDTVNWSTNTTLTLIGSNNVSINAALNAGGNGAGLAIIPNTANGSENPSGQGSYGLGSTITLSGSNPALSIGGSNYTVINSLGAPGDASTAPAIPSLQGMAAGPNLGRKFALGSDIDASATSTWSNGAGFTPIGSEGASFSGTLDGLGHVIKGLSINRPQAVFVGLIGYMAGGSINNLGLRSVSITGATDVAALAAQIQNYSGSINNSFAQGSITAYRYAGGLVGTNSGHISNSFANVSINGTGGYGFGGLVGQNAGPISNSYATGNVLAQVDAGGLAGENYSGGVITGSYATGTVSTGAGNGGMDLGGLVGDQGDDDNGGGSISTSYATGNVNCNDTINANTCKYYGGLVGRMGGQNQGGGSVSNSYASGVVTTNDQYGYIPSGLVGVVYPNSTVTNGYWNSATANGIGWNNGGTVTGGGGLSLSVMQTASYFKGFTFGSGGWVIVDMDGSLNNANGAPGGTTPMLASEFSNVIGGSHQLQLMAMAPAQNYTLRTDISAAINSNGSDVWTKSGFIPIGSGATAFSGTLDGQNHRIDSILIMQPYSSNIGLVSIAGSGALIKRLGITNGNINGNVNVGGIAGYLKSGTISDSFFSGTVNSAGNAAGGIAGASSGTIRNSYAAGSVQSSASDIGGLVGGNSGSISNSYAVAGVSGGPVNVGGLVGGNYTGASISQSYASGAVKGTGSSTGGLVGGNNGSVSNSYWDTATSNQANGIGSGNTSGTSGLNATQMTQPGSFSGWTIATTGGSTAPWRMYPGQTQPLLRAWLTPLAVMPAYNGSAQTLSNIAAYTTSIATPASNEFSGSASGLTLTSSATAGSYNASFSSANFTSVDQQGYDISVVTRTIATPGAAANDIVLAAPLAWSAGTLTISAQRDISINASLAPTGNSGLALQYGQSARAAGNTGNYYINAPLNPASGSTYTTQQGSDGQVIKYQLISALGNPGSTTGSDLQGMNGNPGGNYALIADIDASGTSRWNSGAGFKPVGTFTGNFDGLGHTVRHLTINLPNTTDVGLFGNAGSGAAIRNIGVAGGSITGGGFVGALAGYLNASLISNSYAGNTVTSSNNGVGGLVGFSLGGTVTHSHATGTVTANNDVGGLVGFSIGGGGNAVIQSSYASSTVNGSHQVGGLAGHVAGVATGSGTVQNSYATGAAKGLSNVGGLVGQLEAGATGAVASIGSSYAVGGVHGTVDVGGLVGLNTSGTVAYSYWSIAGTGQAGSAGGGTGLSNGQLKSTAALVGFDFASPTWVIVDNDGTLNNANRAEGNTFPLLASEYSTVIGNAHQLQLMSMAPAASYTLSGAIDASGTAGSGDIWTTAGFTPIGSYAVPFTGSFDGQGNSISNLVIASTGLNRVGLFGIIGASGLVQNAVLSGGTVSGAGGGSVGSLAGINNGSITHSSASVAVNGSAGGFVGGLVGSNNGSISQGQASGAIGGTGGFRGGLVGNNRGSIHTSTASGKVGGSGGYTGAMAGYNSGSIN